MPEYGPNFQVHVQTPFKKLNLYTATLTIVGEDEPLLHTRFCPTPVDALSNLRIMIMVCEDPGAKERLAELREAMRGTQEGAEQESNDDLFKEESSTDPFKGESNTDPFKEESNVNRSEEISDSSSCSSEEMANRIREREMLAELDLLAKEKLAREQWNFTVTQLSGKKSRRATERREKKSRGGD
jgi:hypothetical protein